MTVVCEHNKAHSFRPRVELVSDRLHVHNDDMKKERSALTERGHPHQMVPAAGWTNLNHVARETGLPSVQSFQFPWGGDTPPKSR